VIKIIVFLLFDEKVKPIKIYRLKSRPMWNEVFYNNCYFIY